METKEELATLTKKLSQLQSSQEFKALTIKDTDGWVETLTGLTEHFLNKSEWFGKKLGAVIDTLPKERKRKK